MYTAAFYCLSVPHPLHSIASVLLCSLLSSTVYPLSVSHNVPSVGSMSLCYLLFYSLSTLCQYLTLYRFFVLCDYVHCCLLRCVHCLSVPHTCGNTHMTLNLLPPSHYIRIQFSDSTHSKTLTLFLSPSLFFLSLCLNSVSRKQSECNYFYILHQNSAVTLLMSISISGNFSLSCTSIMAFSVRPSQMKLLTRGRNLARSACRRTPVC
jgi:hypothetical protein